MTQSSNFENFEICTINQLRPGHVVFEDVTIENRRLLTKGHILNERIINILKNRNVKKIKIEKMASHIESAPLNVPTIDETELLLQQIEQEIFQFSEQIQLDPVLPVAPISLDHILAGPLEHEYLNILEKLSSEMRYGKALHDPNDIQFLKDLFFGFLENGEIAKHLTDLKQHDEISYLHSIDVFTLGTLFALKEGFEQIEDIALGYLLHDIGKIRVPNSLLNKVEKLAHDEFEIIQQHTLHGFDILSSTNFAHIAHFAKSHHERIDGSGYPESLIGDEISKELQILQLVDTYSAMTLDRSYKEAMNSLTVIERLFKQTGQYQLGLIHRFVDLIGIYPENSVVLLSDGHHALVEKAHLLHPLVPTIKIFHTNENSVIPNELSLSITKILSYYIATPEELFHKFSGLLINNDQHAVLLYYNKLKEHYHKNEYFTHIYLPVFNIFRIIEANRIVPEIRLKEVRKLLLTLLDGALKQFRVDNSRSEKVVILFDSDLPLPIVKIFEGLLHSSNHYPFMLSTTLPKDSLEKMISFCKANIVICIGEKFKNTIPSNGEYYHLTEGQLTSLLSQYMYRDAQQFKLSYELSNYYKTNKLSVAELE